MFYCDRVLQVRDTCRVKMRHSLTSCGCNIHEKLDCIMVYGSSVMCKLCKFFVVSSNAIMRTARLVVKDVTKEYILMHLYLFFSHSIRHSYNLQVCFMLVDIVSYSNITRQVTLFLTHFRHSRLVIVSSCFRYLPALYV